MKLVQFEPETVNQDAIEILEDALRLAKEGVIVDVAVATVMKDDEGYSINGAHTSHRQKPMLIGAVDSLKFELHYGDFRLAEENGQLDIDS